MPKNYHAAGLELITCSEAALRLGVSRNFLQKLRGWTGIQPIKVARGMTLVFTREQLVALQKELLRRYPGHDFRKMRAPGRPRRTESFGG